MQAIKNQLVTENKFELFANYIIIPASVIIGFLLIKKKVFWKQ
jgi:putative flippase GtrA